MTTIREHRDYSSNVIRDLSSSRPVTPYQNKLDSNLDYLLEDLQNSVSRPGSSLGQPIKQQSSHSSYQTSYLQPVNSTTVVCERSVSPSTQKQFYTATSKYEYKTSVDGKPVHDAKYAYKSAVDGKTSGNSSLNDTTTTSVYKNNISQLDNLLNDLERERDTTLDRSKVSHQSQSHALNLSNLPNLGVDPTLEPGQTKVIKTTTFHETGNKTVARELVYDPPSADSSLRRLRPISPNYDNRDYRELDSQIVTNKSLTNGSIYGGIKRFDDTPLKSEQYYSESSSSKKSLVPKVQYNEHTEVTDTTELENLDIDKDMLPPPGTKVTKTVRTYTYELPEEPDLGIVNKKITVKDETTSKTTTLPLQAERDIPLDFPIPDGAQLTTYRSDAAYPTMVDGVPSAAQNKAMYYKKETKTSSTDYYPGTPQMPRLMPPPEDTRPVQVYHETIMQPGRPGAEPPYGKSVSSYNYSSSTTRRDNRYPPESQLPHFPVDSNDGPANGNPPRRVEDLMASFGDTTISSDVEIVDSGTRRRRVEAAESPITPIRIEEKRTLLPIQKDNEPSKNQPGSPVYYPPNHEMLTSKEESAAWQAGGGWAKGRGEYEYKADSKSKNSSKKGGAVVPVCLPLCCAMPCSIM